MHRAAEALEFEQAGIFEQPRDPPDRVRHHRVCRIAFERALVLQHRVEVILRPLRLVAQPEVVQVRPLVARVLVLDAAGRAAVDDVEQPGRGAVVRPAPDHVRRERVAGGDRDGERLLGRRDPRNEILHDLLRERGEDLDGQRGDAAGFLADLAGAHLAFVAAEERAEEAAEVVRDPRILAAALLLAEVLADRDDRHHLELRVQADHRVLEDERARDLAIRVGDDLVLFGELARRLAPVVPVRHRFLGEFDARQLVVCDPCLAEDDRLRVARVECRLAGQARQPFDVEYLVVVGDVDQPVVRDLGHRVEQVALEIGCEPAQLGGRKGLELPRFVGRLGDDPFQVLHVEAADRDGPDAGDLHLGRLDHLELEPFRRRARLRENNNRRQ
ncbi:MAG: hypothetical protein RDV41_14500 [Planctomycetota bacterium]|nr:hypothetical protein [Planctomycetota bacterium]